MESRTKTRLTGETVARLARLHFPDGDVSRIEELADGLFNAVYRVYGTGPLRDGPVLKVGPSPDAQVLTYERGILETEVRVLRLLEHSGLPVPKVLAAGFSREIIPAGYFWMTALPGVSWKRAERQITPGKRAKLMEALGRAYALVHQVKGDAFGYRTDPDGSWGGGFYKMVDSALNDAGAMGYPLPYGRIRRLLARSRPLLDAVKTPTLVGYDIWAGNVLIDDTGFDRITGIVDFERSFFGDRFADFTAAYDIFDDVGQEPDFQRGYAAVSGEPFAVSPDDRKRMRLYRFYMTLLLYIESYRYGPEAAESIRRTVGEALAGMLDAIEADLPQ